MAIKTELLEEIGLTKSEIKVYLTLLELGSASSGPIVDKSGASSSKIYEILEKLIQKGLVSYIVKSGVKYFEAAEPQRIVDYVQEKEKELHEQTRKVTELLPELELQRKLSKYKSEATIYKGMKGLETAFKDIFHVLKKGDTNYVFVVGELDDRMNQFFKRQYELRSKAGIKTKTIFSEAGRKYYESRKKVSLFEGKVIGTTTSPATINIYGSKVNIRMGTSTEVFCVVIENKELADSFLEQFNLFWNQDITVVKGMNTLIEALKRLIDEIKPGDTFDALGTAFGVKGYEEIYAKAFGEFHQYRMKKGISARWLFQQGSQRFIERYAQNYTLGTIKFLPYQTESPVGIYPYKNSTLLVILQPEPTIITINNKEVTTSFTKHFESLWNQEVRILRGLDAVKSIFEEMLRYGSVDFIGARGYFVGLSPKEYIDDWEKRASKIGFTMRNIVDPEVRGHRITSFPFAQTKYTLPQEFSKLSVFWIYGNKVVITNWVEKEPIAVIIENKNLHDAYKQQFELLWNQKMVSFEGEAGVRAVFDDMLNYNNIYFIGGNGGIKKYFPQYWEDHNKERVKRKVRWHDLIDATRLSELFSGQKLEKVPYYEYKILPLELSSPHVIAFYGDKVANIIWREKTMVTIIEDKEIRAGYQKYFDYLWKTIR